MKATEDKADATWALGKALRNIRDNNRQSKSVIVFPWTSKIGVAAPGLHVAWGLDWEFVVQNTLDILDEDAMPVVSAGNDADCSHRVDTLPACFAQLRDQVFDKMLVAPAVKLSRSRPSFSQVASGGVFASGVNIKCARQDGEQTAQGTSFFAPMVGDSQTQQRKRGTDQTSGRGTRSIFNQGWMTP